MKPKICTFSGSLTSTPTSTEIHDDGQREGEQQGERAEQRRPRPLPSRKPRITPTPTSSDTDHACLTVSARIRPASGDQRAIGSARSRSKTPLVRSLFSPNAGGHGGEEGVLHDDAGQRELQVLARGAGDRPAEDVREEQHEHHRLDAQVEQLHRVVLDLHQAAPGQGERCAAARRRGPSRRAGASGAAVTVAAVMPDPFQFDVGRPSCSARWPVRERKTSSRLEPRSASSATVDPGRRRAAAPRRATRRGRSPAR